MEDIRVEKFNPEHVRSQAILATGNSDKVKTEIKNNLSEESYQPNAQQEEFHSDLTPPEFVEKANQMADASNKEITFELDEKGDTPTIIITDKESGKVIRQIPTEEMIRLSDKMEEFVGMIYDERG